MTSTQNIPLKVFITGVTSGFGKTLMIHLLAEGHHVRGFVRNETQAEALRNELKARFSKSSYLIDSGFELQATDIERKIFVFANRPAPDVLVNAAGYSQWGSIESSRLAEIEQEFRVNTFVPMLFASAFLPQWRREGRGHIINIGSTADDMPKPFGAIYAASKVALRALTLGLAAEVLPWNVRVSLVEPGPYQTHYSQNRRISRGEILADYLETHKAEEPPRHRQAPNPKPVIDLLFDLVTGKTGWYKGPQGVIYRV